MAGWQAVTVTGWTKTRRAFLSTVILTETATNCKAALEISPPI